MTKMRMGVCVCVENGEVITPKFLKSEEHKHRKYHMFRDASPLASRDPVQ
jgi:hypothetical protein